MLSVIIRKLNFKTTMQRSNSEGTSLPTLLTKEVKHYNTDLNIFYIRYSN